MAISRLFFGPLVGLSFSRTYKGRLIWLFTDLLRVLVFAPSSLRPSAFFSHTLPAVFCFSMVSLVFFSCIGGFSCLVSRSSFFLFHSPSLPSVCPGTSHSLAFIYFPHLLPLRFPVWSFPTWFVFPRVVQVITCRFSLTRFFGLPRCFCIPQSLFRSPLVSSFLCRVSCSGVRV